MQDREFSVKKSEGLIDIRATSENIKRRGKYVCNLWMGALTISEARDLINKLGEIL